MEEEQIIKTMIDKSIEAFLLGIEIFNKPTIQYRLEGFTFFLTNAWELLLKAKIIKDFGENEIYYKNKKNRSITINDSIKRIFTNENDYVRRNLEIIAGLRNTATHLIIPEYEESYLPFLQSNVLNYSSKLYEFFNINISNYISSNFLTLVVGHKERIQPQNVLEKYGNIIYEKYANITKDLLLESKSNNNKLSIPISLNVKIVKKDSDFTVSINDEDNNGVNFVKEIINIDAQYPFKQRDIREIVQNKLKEQNIEVNLHQTNLNYICKEYNLKENKKYYYKLTSFNNQYRCSEELISFLISLFVGNRNLLEEIREKYTKKS